MDLGPDQKAGLRLVGPWWVAMLLGAFAVGQLTAAVTNLAQGREHGWDLAFDAARIGLGLGAIALGVRLFGPRVGSWLRGRRG